MRSLEAALRRSAIAAGLLVAQLPGCAREGSADPASGKAALVVGQPGVTPGRFRLPRALALDAQGNLYVADRTGRIQAFSAAGELIVQWWLPAHDLGQPVGIETTAAGELLVSDSHYQRILRYDTRSLLASASEAGTETRPAAAATWGSAGKGPGQLTVGRDVAIDSAGNVYVGDYGGLNDRIEKFSALGEFITQWGKRGAAPGDFDRPEGMAIESAGGKERLLVADCANHRIQRFELDGRFVSLWGGLGAEPGRLRYPMSVAAARDGTVFVCEWGNNRIQRFDAAGNSLGVWGRAGRGDGELLTPWDIEIGPDDRLYIADCGNHRVQVIEWLDEPED